MTQRDLVDLAKVCLRRAEAADSPETADALKRMAQEYWERAKELDPALDEPELRAIGCGLV